MKYALRAAAGAAFFFLAACNASGVVTHAVRPTAVTDVASIERNKASFESLAAMGYHYRVAGRLSDIRVRSVNGRAVVSAHAVPGDYLSIRLEKMPANVFSFNPNRTTSSFTGNPDCDECYTNNASPTPNPQSTTPPNYNGCKSVGGATWFDETSGTGGCLGPGASKGLPCGIWSYSSPGRGHFRSWDGTLDNDGWTFISLDPDGQTCHLGY